MCGDTEEILQPLAKKDRSKLLELLKQDSPKSTVVCNWIENQLKWELKIPNLQVQLLCPHGEWSHGIVIALSQGLMTDDLVHGVLYTVGENGEMLKKALLTTKMIPWEKMYYFAGVLEQHMPFVEDAFLAKGLKFEELRPCQLHYITSKDAAQITVPETPAGVRIGCLDLSHLDTVCENWPHYRPVARPVVQAMIEHNPSVAVFITEEGKEEQLGAMVLQSDYGGIGLLQTLPNFRRRGLASLAMIHQVRKLGLLEINPHFHVINNNYNALAMFKNLGFKSIGETNWVVLVK